MATPRIRFVNTASSAANRFDLPNGFPFFLMPGDRITLAYSGTLQRWQAQSASANLSQMGLTLFTDCLGGTGTGNLAHGSGGVTIFASGTGAAAAASTYLNNTTERPMGIIQVTSGTTTTGRAPPRCECQRRRGHESRLRSVTISPPVFVS